MMKTNPASTFATAAAMTLLGSLALAGCNSKRDADAAPPIGVAEQAGAAADATAQQTMDAANAAAAKTADVARNAAAETINAAEQATAKASNALQNAGAELPK